MFSDNLKISSRQLKRMMVINWIGRMNLIIPGIALTVAGGSGAVSIIIGIAATLIYALLICHIAKNIKVSFHAYLVSRIGKLGSLIIKLVYVLFIMISTVFTIRLLTEIVKQTILPEMNTTIILIIVIATCGYGASGKLEGRARASEAIFGIIMIPLIIMLCLSVSGLKTEYLMDTSIASGGSILKGAIGVFVVFGEISILMLTAPYVENEERIKSKVMQAIVITGIGTLGVFIATLGMFGENSMKALKWPIISLMSSVNVPGGFLERWDIIFIMLVIISIFVGISGGIFYVSMMMQEIIRKKQINIYIIPAMIVIFFAAVSFTDYAAAYNFYISIMTYFFVPITVLITIILWILECAGKNSVKGGSS